MRKSLHAFPLIPYNLWLWGSAWRPKGPPELRYNYVYHLLIMVIIFGYNADPSVITFAPANQSVLEGGNLTLYCNATGNPAPNITWTKDSSSTVVHQGETYSIVNIQRQAAGDYKCTAWNKVGTQKTGLSTVTIHCK